MIRDLYSWMGKKVYSKHATAMLAMLFYLEAIFFLPTDPMLIFYCIERRDRALFYATVATIASVLGGITAYCIGYVLWEYAGQQIIHNSLINYIISPQLFSALCTKYKEYESLAILVAGFTPVPYKAATLTAGFCKLSVAPFIICSIIARGARFFLLALAIRKWGVQIKEYIDRYFNLLVILVVLIISISIWLCKY